MEEEDAAIDFNDHEISFANSRFAINVRKRKSHKITERFFDSRRFFLFSQFFFIAAHCDVEIC